MEKHNKDVIEQNEQLNLTTIVEDLLQGAKKKGASAAVVSSAIKNGFSTTVRKGEVETIQFNRDKSAHITVYFGHRIGSASTSDFSTQALQSTLASACEIAQATAEDLCFGLADPELMAYNYPELALNYPWHISPEEAIELAKACEAAAFKQDKRIINSEGASLNTGQVFEIYGNSHGFIGTSIKTMHELDCTLVAREDNRMQRDYYYTVARDRQDLESGQQVAKKAVERTVNRLGARQLSTRKAPVIFDAAIASGLFANFIQAISGGNLYRKSSLLVDHLNQQIFPEFIQIKECPYLAKGYGSAAFDSDGVRTVEKDIVRDGILQTYLLGNYSAKKLGLKTTANAGGVHNMVVNTQSLDLKGLFKQMGTGLYLTEIIGHGVNLLTGDYSHGAVGFWVEGGEIQYPVEQITIASNLREMWQNIKAIANDVDLRGNIQTGSVLIDPMIIAGE